MNGGLCLLSLACLRSLTTAILKPIMRGMSRHMRTTVRLPEGQPGEARSKPSRRNVAALIEQGLRLVLAQSHAQRIRRKPVKLPVSTAGGGVLPGVDLNDGATLTDIMEGRR